MENGKVRYGIVDKFGTPSLIYNLTKVRKKKPIRVMCICNNFWQYHEKIDVSFNLDFF
jgi:hypothetical protein